MIMDDGSEESSDKSSSFAQSSSLSSSFFSSFFSIFGGARRSTDDGRRGPEEEEEGSSFFTGNFGTAGNLGGGKPGCARPGGGLSADPLTAIGRFAVDGCGSDFGSCFAGRVSGV